MQPMRRKPKSAYQRDDEFDSEKEAETYEANRASPAECEECGTSLEESGGLFNHFMQCPECGRHYA